MARRQPRNPQLHLSRVLDRSFKVFKKGFPKLFIISLLLALPEAILITYFLFIETHNTLTCINNNYSVNNPYVNSCSSSLNPKYFLGVGAITLVLSFINTSIIQITAINVTADIFFGSQRNFKELIKSALARFFPIIWTLIVALALFIAPILLSFALIALLVKILPLGIKILLITLVIVTQVGWLLYGWANFLLLPSVVVVEKTSGIKAIKRTVKLSYGYTVSIIALDIVIAFISSIIATAITLLITILVSFSAELAFVVQVASGYLVSNVLLLTFTTTAMSVYYLLLRVYKEGLDIEMLAQQLGTNFDPSSSLSIPLFTITPNVPKISPYPSSYQPYGNQYYPQPTQPYYQQFPQNYPSSYGPYSVPAQPSPYSQSYQQTSYPQYQQGQIPQQSNPSQPIAQPQHLPATPPLPDPNVIPSSPPGDDDNTLGKNPGSQNT